MFFIRKQKGNIFFKKQKSSAKSVPKFHNYIYNDEG